MTIHNFGISNESPSMAECTIEMHAKRLFQQIEFHSSFLILFRFCVRVRFWSNRIVTNIEYGGYAAPNDACSGNTVNVVRIKRCFRITQMSYYSIDFFRFMLYLMQQHRQKLTINASTFRIRFYQSHNCRISSCCLYNQWNFR